MKGFPVPAQACSFDRHRMSSLPRVQSACTNALLASGDSRCPRRALTGAGLLRPSAVLAVKYPQPHPSPKTSEGSGLGRHSGLVFFTAHRRRAARVRTVRPAQPWSSACLTSLSAQTRSALQRIGASGRRLRGTGRQHRSTSTNRKKIGWYGFHDSSRYTSLRPVRTIWHGSRTNACTKA